MLFPMRVRRAAFLLALAVFGAPALAQAPGADRIATAAALADDIARAVVRSAPFKQFDLATGAPDRRLGRTPGAGCEALRFLAAYVRRRPQAAEAAAKAAELAAWIENLQAADPALPSFGGVPSAPDTPESASFYAIDAALCAEAMLEAEATFATGRHAAAAERFGLFLLAMQSGPGRWPERMPEEGSAFCEAVVTVPATAWNCRYYVKLLVALPALAALSERTGDRRFAQAAANARAVLLPGLEGGWEYGEQGWFGALGWRRVQGPYEERDHFVYGDTAAYALKGLALTEGASPDVRRIYKGFMAYGPGGPRTHGYDPRFALAGYLIPDARAADEFSAYYDIVTAGILDSARAVASPEDRAHALSLLLARLGGQAPRHWLMRMDGEVPAGGLTDVTTLANVGEAALRATDGTP